MRSAVMALYRTLTFHNRDPGADQWLYEDALPSLGVVCSAHQQLGKKEATRRRFTNHGLAASTSGYSLCLEKRALGGAMQNNSGFPI